MKQQIVLASSSSYRRQLLHKLIDKFETCDPAVDESRQAGEPAAALVQRLALAKAKQVAPRFPNALIVGSDQVACLGDDILSKPGDFPRAQQQLLRCSGQRVRFETGLCLLDSASGNYDLLCESFLVHFRTLSQLEIDAYLHREQPYDCAGSFKAEGLGICLFSALEGKDPNTLVGLPLITLAGLLRKHDCNPLLMGSANT
jgi:septum formation protein